MIRSRDGHLPCSNGAAITAPASRSRQRMPASPGCYWRRTPSSSPLNRQRQTEPNLLSGGSTDQHALHSLSKTDQTGARGTISTYERKSLPNDRGASARLTSGPECMALISGRLESRSLSFLAHRDAAKETGIRKIC